LDKSTAKITNLAASLGSSNITAKADIDFSKPALEYNSNINISISLKEIADIAKEMLAAFNLNGSINGHLSAASGKTMPNVKGSITFKDLGAVVLARPLQGLNGIITINSIDDIKTNLIQGSFDSSAFKTSLAYLKQGKTSNIDFFFDMDKFTLDDINFDELLAKKSDPAPEAKTNAKDADSVQKVASQRTDPINFKANIAVHEVSNNIFTTNELTLKADIQNFDNVMDRANGTLSFSTVNGEIRDLDKLMSSSIIFKILFTSVRIVQKAFSVVKLDKMFSIGQGKVSYSTIEGAYTLNNGLVNIDKSQIVSDLTTVKASGNINLVSSKLAMKIESHLGKVTSSGFKPVVINVSGNLDDPSFKLDVVSTVASLVTVPGNVAKGGVNTATGAVKTTADTVKDIASGLGGLLKKKSK
ncbi:MAG: AsmA-like C-terminal region-containing protein, partial [Elusimicrobiota bacterium]|nr:AsmA-like C-terminal region-containing protein [Elusimicrobiota bacterium]